MPKPLAVTLPSDCEVRVTRTFNAPRKLVWEAHTKPELLQKWCSGLPGWSMPVCEMDVRPGGKYKWRWKNDADGKEMGFYGTFDDVEAPARLVHDQYYDPGDMGGAMPVGDPTLVTLELTESGGVTTLVCTMRFASKAARDDAASTGMTDGMEMSYARLDEVVQRAA